MTATAQKSQDADLGSVAEPTPAPVVVRRPQSRRSNRRRRHLLAWQVGSTICFVLLAAGLAYVGYRASLLITGGNELDVTDPEAPGYVAEVKPTPVDLLALTDEEGTLVSGVVLSAGAGGADGAVVVPMPRDMSVPGTTGLAQPVAVGDLRTLDQVYAEGGVENLRSRVGEALTFGFSSATVVTPDQMEALARLAGPITITNPDNLLELQENGDEVVRYKAGQITLQPDEVVPFLAFGGSNESVPNQELRHEAVWNALLSALAGTGRRDLERAAGGDVTGADASASVGGLLADLLAGPVRFDSVPLSRIPVPGTIYEVFAPDQGTLPTFVLRNVPSPTSGVPGQRARVRVLNGTEDRTLTTAVVPKVVGAGGEVTMVGNADSFDVATTRVEYVVPEARSAAERIALALGVPATRSRSEQANVDVEVVIGRDRAS